MDPEEGLEAAKEPVYEFPSDLKTLGRSDPLRTYAMTLLIAPWLFAALLMTLLIAISLRCPFYIR